MIKRGRNYSHSLSFIECRCSAKFLIPFFCCILFSGLPAQFDHGITLCASFTVPVDDFSDDDEFVNDGYALVGFGGGVQHSVAFGIPWLALATEVSFLANFLDHDEIEDTYPGQVLENVDGGHYFSLPILSGIKLIPPVHSPVEPFGIFQLGLNIFFESDLDGRVVVPVIGSEYALDRDFEPDVEFALGLGGGAVVADHFVVMVQYLNMGEPSIDYNQRIGTADPTSEQREFDAALVRFSVGYDF
ncbi:MAG: hypothetical protein GF350_06710 [Chitinivibrionales bacterium]|nr:hypothetical protein [Chitinivibrionales bacterium]